MLWLPLCALLAGGCSGVPAGLSPLGAEGADAGPIPPPESAAPSRSPCLADVCFAVAPELEARYPRVRELAVEALDRWGLGLGLGFDDAAPNRLELAQIPNGAHPSARHRPARMPDGTVATATQGGASLITIDPDAVLTEATPDECVATWSEGEVMPGLLVRVLTHEFGHMLGLPDETDDYDAAMYWATRNCTDLHPTSAELASVAR